jgi:hypothetical protein
MAQTSTEDCYVMRALANVNERDAEKQILKIPTENNLTLDVPITYEQIGTLKEYPSLKPRDLIEKLVSEGKTHMVMGFDSNYSASTLISNMHLCVCTHSIMISRCTCPYLQRYLLWEGCKEQDVDNDKHLMAFILQLDLCRS